jgi:LCP family protein required for cell wall assembly
VFKFAKKHDNTKELVQKPPVYTKEKIAMSRTKRRLLKHLWLVRSAIAILILFLVVAGLLVVGRVVGSFGVANYLSLARDFILPSTADIRSYNGRINFLILGKGGEDHTAPDLTDTIVFISVSLGRPSIVSVSIPRDIWIPSIRAKINSAYYWGKQREPGGGGLILAKATAEEIIGRPINYAAVIDFGGFTKIIDVLGGIGVDVKNGFIDSKYPIAGRENDTCGGDPNYKCRYETVEFKKGIQKMDGETALKYVRSRNAEGDEGTDIAREGRQETVIKAIKNKIFSREVLLSPKKLIALYKAVMEYTETDATPSVFAVIARRIIVSRNNIVSEIIPEEYLINPPKSFKYDNLYVFVPKSGSWDNVHVWVKSLLD